MLLSFSKRKGRALGKTFSLGGGGGGARGDGY